MKYQSTRGQVKGLTFEGKLSHRYPYVYGRWLVKFPAMKGYESLFDATHYILGGQL